MQLYLSRLKPSQTRCNTIGCCVSAGSSTETNSKTLRRFRYLWDVRSPPLKETILTLKLYIGFRRPVLYLLN